MYINKLTIATLSIVFLLVCSVILIGANHEKEKWEYCEYMSMRIVGMTLSTSHTISTISNSFYMADRIEEKKGSEGHHVKIYINGEKYSSEIIETPDHKGFMKKTISYEKFMQDEKIYYQKLSKSKDEFLKLLSASEELVIMTAYISNAFTGDRVPLSILDILGEQGWELVDETHSSSSKITKTTFRLKRLK